MLNEWRENVYLIDVKSELFMPIRFVTGHKCNKSCAYFSLFIARVWKIKVEGF